MRRLGFACFSLEGRAIQEFGLHDDVGFGNFQIVGIVNRCDRGRIWSGGIDRLHCHVFEECRELPELLPLPGGEWMIVALGTLQLNSQEHARGTGSQLLRFIGRRQIKRRGAWFAGLGLNVADVGRQ